MGKFFDTIPDFVVRQIEKQHMFWVATAPLSAEGHVNVSSKGLEGTFHVVDERTVWYEDLTGSGNETISHLREPGNGRITVFFNALFGKGVVHEYGSPEYEELLPPEKRQPGSRSVIKVDVHKVGTSCGYAVPYYNFVGHRTRLLEFCERLEQVENAEDENGNGKGVGLRQYWIKNNLQSIDGLPGMVSGHVGTGKVGSVKVPKEEQRRKYGCFHGYAGTVGGFVLGVVAMGVYSRAVAGL
ncbi:hypothetical protein BDZ89DRAFT_1093623 [Hymenopellis radicata]|nr:hypothetical protein BDZ89DRAFT_1093623 [Hymenopellis radicata]